MNEPKISVMIVFTNYLYYDNRKPVTVEGGFTTIDEVNKLIRRIEGIKSKDGNVAAQLFFRLKEFDPDQADRLEKMSRDNADPSLLTEGYNTENPGVRATDSFRNKLLGVNLSPEM